MTSKDMENKSNSIIKICNHQTFDNHTDEINVASEGMFSKVNGTYFIMYKEYTEFGDVSVLIKARDNKVTIKRSGASSSKMEYEAQKHYEVVYSVPFGDMVMDLKTDKVKVDLSEKGGTIELKYSLSVCKDEYYNDMKLTVEVKEDNNEI